MLLNFFNLTLLLLCCIIQTECCTKVTFVNTAIEMQKIYPNPSITTTITGCITPEIISQKLGQVTIMYIVCDNQSIPTFYEKAVSNLPELISLQFRYSKIKRIEENAFFNLPKLQSLDLSNNEIATIDQNAFQKLDLKNINLRGNKLIFLEHGIFANLPNLSELRLDINELEAFEPEWFTESSKLLLVSISNNFIRTIQKQTFKPFKSLQNIDLSSNHIYYIHKAAFYGLENLYLLNLQNNRIKKLDQDVFRSLKTVSMLWLAVNNLTYISDKILEDLTNGLLVQITIHSNPWQCACYDKIIKWAKEASVEVASIDCYFESNPVCVIPVENEDICLEVREEDLQSIFYKSVRFNHTCIDNYNNDYE